MWAMTSYYNPVGYKRRLTNYRAFREFLGIPLVTVELSFDGRFALADGDADILIQISGGAVLWQKERLLNVALKAIPPDVGEIAWIDCDVIFERPDWMDEATRQLGRFDLVQLFSDTVDLERDRLRLTADCHDAPRSGRGVVSLINEKPFETATLLEQVARSKSLGFAWAAKRELLDNYGLYDATILGGGDRALVAAVYGEFEALIRHHHLNAARRRHYVDWARRFHDAVSGRIGYVPGRLYHLWHGDVEKRNYGDRHRLLAAFDLAPEADLAIGANGAWHWARPRPDLEQFFADYFGSRAEDG